MLYLTFQTTNGQAVYADNQPEQLHVGPLAHVQWYAGGIEVEIERGAGNECIVSEARTVPGESGQGYAVQTITANEFPALRAFNGVNFGSVIVHDGNVACFDRAQAQTRGEPIIDLRDYHVA